TNVTFLLYLVLFFIFFFFFFSSRRRHTRSDRDWSSDVCPSDLESGNWGKRRRTRCSSFVPDHRPIWIASALVAARSRWCASSKRSEERRVGKECRSGWWAER